MKFLSIFLIISISLFVMNIEVVDGSLLGSIDTDKNVYDVNDPILITYNVSSDAFGLPDTAELLMEGNFPSYNGIFLRQSDYFGRKFFEGNDISNSSVAYFKNIKSFKVFDIPDSASSFIPIPPIHGTVNAYVKPSIVGEYPDFLGKVNIFFDMSNIVKTIYVTRERPSIILTNNTMQFKDAYTTNDILIINYFCKNNCSIIGVDEANPANPNKILQFGISDINGKTLTTSDTNEWKQIIVDLSASGYTPDDDFVRLTITDTKGNTDEATFFVYQPTSDVIRLNKNVVFDVGTNFNNRPTFNNTMGLIYKTPDVNSEYRIRANAFPTGFYPMTSAETLKCGATFILNGVFIIYPINGVISPDNGIKFISLQDGNIYNEFQSKFNCFVSSSKNVLNTDVTFKLQRLDKILFIYDSWTDIGSTIGTIKANRIDMNVISFDNQFKPKSTFDMLSVVDSFGFRGTLGHLLFAIIFLGITFYALIRIVKLDVKIAILFDAFELWYFVYAGFIDMILLVIIVVIVAIAYTTKLLRFLRAEPPSSPEGEV